MWVTFYSLDVGLILLISISEKRLKKRVLSVAKRFAFFFALSIVSLHQILTWQRLATRAHACARGFGPLLVSRTVVVSDRATLSERSLIRSSG